ncbi:MAG TPA: hypothetical protein VM537_34405 [Anaerolineae bacterium]|nr:hypothetical protein [Anaerolineae bacterium]
MNGFEKVTSAMDAAEAAVTFREILEVKAGGSPRELNEVSLSRVYQHTKGERSWSILTSWRSGNSPQENRADFGQLKGLIRSLGLGFFRLLGHWRECQNKQVAYSDCPESDLVDSQEPSLFVIGITKQQAVKLMRRYNQDAIVYSGPETDNQVTLIEHPAKETNIGKFHPGRVAQAYSRLKGRPFAFEGFEYIAQGHVEAMVEQVFWRDREDMDA